MFIDKDTIRDIENTILKEINNNNYSQTLEKILVENRLLTDYDALERRFNSNNISYNFSSLEDLEKIYGFRVELVQGYNQLSTYHKKLFDKYILNFIGSGGLSSKLHNLPRKIELEVGKHRFKVYTLGIDTYSYLNFNGEWY